MEIQIIEVLATLYQPTCIEGAVCMYTYSFE